MGKNFNRSLALVMAELFAFGRLVGLVMATVGIRSGPPPDEKRFGVRRKTMLERQGHHSQCAMVCMGLRPDAVGGLSGLGQRRGAATAWIVAETTPALVFQHLMAWFSYRNVATTSIPRHLESCQDNWLRNEPLWAAVFNSVLASVRV